MIFPNGNCNFYLIFSDSDPTTHSNVSEVAKNEVSVDDAYVKEVIDAIVQDPQIGNEE